MFEPEQIVLEAFGRWALLRLATHVMPGLAQELDALALHREEMQRRKLRRLAQQEPATEPHRRVWPSSVAEHVAEHAASVCHCARCALRLARPGYVVMPEHIVN